MLLLLFFLKNRLLFFCYLFILFSISILWIINGFIVAFLLYSWFDDCRTWWFIRFLFRLLGFEWFIELMFYFIRIYFYKGLFRFYSWRFSFWGHFLLYVCSSALYFGRKLGLLFCAENRLLHKPIKIGIAQQILQVLYRIIIHGLLLLSYLTPNIILSTSW